MSDASNPQLHPDVSLAVSYYILYAQIEHDGQQRNKRKDSAGITATNEQQQQQQQQQQPSDMIDNEETFWIEDNWSEQDELQVQAMLERNRDRCRAAVLLDGDDDDNATNEMQKNSQAWDQFYSQHQTNFFKDRYYLASAFPDEFGVENNIKKTNSPCLVEVGCGVGNAMLPLLEEKYEQNGQKRWKVYGLDLSAVAIDLVQKDPRFKAAAEENRAFAASVDISQNDGVLPESFVAVATVTSLLFCLSAIDPKRHLIAVQNAISTLQSGGVLVFRDYGRYDEAQLKLGMQRNKLLKDNFYRKADGTKCYYFTLAELEQLFVQEAGLEVLELRYLKRMYKNRSTGTIRRRVWVQARFRKPEVATESSGASRVERLL